MPFKIYYPTEAQGARPVVIFSHGLGGNRDGAEYLRVINQRPRYVKVEGDVFCMIEKVRRHDAYGNRYFAHVRKCENRVVDVY